MTMETDHSNTSEDITNSNNSNTTHNTLNVQFFTHLPTLPPTLPVVALPVHLRRYALSEVVNMLLQTTETPTPYDFLVNGEFLRTSLEKYLELHGLSSEQLLKIEYIESITPPSDSISYPHDDWISVVRGLHTKGLNISGAFDNKIRFWNLSKECVLTVDAHAKAVRDICLLPSDENQISFLSSSDDCSVKQWSITGLEEGQLSSSLVAEYSGQDATVSCVTSSPSGAQFITGCWDSQISVYNTRAQEKTASKKRKHEKVAGAEPIQSMKGHSEKVSGVVWHDQTTMYSASWDMSVKQWDISSGICQTNLSGPEAVTTLALSNLLPHTPITGHSDRSIRVWDPRSSEGVVVKLRMMSHSSWVADLATSSSNMFMFCSCSHDGSIKLWDIRSTKPLFTVVDPNAKTKSIFSVDWDDQYLLSGGVDGTFHVRTLSSIPELRQSS